jgi:hypothetical protein
VTVTIDHNFDSLSPPRGDSRAGQFSCRDCTGHRSFGRAATPCFVQIPNEVLAPSHEHIARPHRSYADRFECGCVVLQALSSSAGRRSLGCYGTTDDPFGAVTMSPCHANDMPSCFHIALTQIKSSSHFNSIVRIRSHGTSSWFDAIQGTKPQQRGSPRTQVPPSLLRVQPAALSRNSEMFAHSRLVSKPHASSSASNTDHDLDLDDTELFLPLSDLPGSHYGGVLGYSLTGADWYMLATVGKPSLALSLSLLHRHPEKYADACV